MTQTSVVRLLVWVAALGGGVCTARSAAAESRELLPIIAPAAEETHATEAQAEGADSPVAADLNTGSRPAKAKKSAKSKAAARRSGPGGRQPTAEYRRMRDGWHEPIPPEQIEPVEEGAFPALVLVPINAHGGERVNLIPQSDEGGFTAEQQAQAARAFTPAGRKKPHPIAPRLLDLVYRAMRHFDAPLVHLISGYRADRAGSRHTQGRAIDMVLPGVSNEQLAEYVRQFGFVGVGVYPKSGFVHLDVRDTSFFWLDYSLPDERCRPQPTLLGEAKLVDEAARERGEAPNSFVPNNDREDKAAARAYHRRTQRRRLAAQNPRNL